MTMHPTAADSLTLLVFTLGAAAESARRTLVPERLRPLEVGLRQGCLEAALAAGRACGCRLEVSSPAPLRLPEEVAQVPQPGPDFGSRLERAMAGAFARGASPLLVVGTDVPGLGARHLAAALAALAADPEKVVLGPSPDGGLYLLAASRPLPALTAVRWCRRDTLRRLVALLRSAGRPVVLLAPLADLDGPADLERWLAGGARAESATAATPGLVRQLRQLLAARRRPLVHAHPGLPRPPLLSPSPGRSPPAPRG
jgi:uncharacterized protein DUF2064